MRKITLACHFRFVSPPEHWTILWLRRWYSFWLAWHVRGAPLCQGLGRNVFVKFFVQFFSRDAKKSKDQKRLARMLCVCFHRTRNKLFKNINDYASTPVAATWHTATYVHRVSRPRDPRKSTGSRLFFDRGNVRIT